MFTALLFLIAKMWKQFRYLSADEQKNRMWYIHIMGYYLAIKVNFSCIYNTDGP